MIKHFLQLAVLASLRLLKTKEACSCLCFSESGRSLFSFHPRLKSFFFLNVNRLVSASLIRKRLRGCAQTGDVFPLTEALFQETVGGRAEKFSLELQRKKAFV